MTLNATALSEQFEKGRSPGTLETLPGSLIFKTENTAAIKMPLRGIEMRIGGAGNRYVFFTHPQVPGITLYTDDLRILKHDEIRFDPVLSEVLTKLRNRKRGIMAGIGILAGIFIAAIVSLFILKGRIIEHIAGLVPPAREQAISESMLSSAIAGKTVLKDSGIMAGLAQITQPLQQAVDDSSFHFTFTIVKDPVLNAFALPGGAVVIHSGLIEKANSAEELAGVLAHEISHVTRRHHLRGIIGNMGIFILIRGLLGDIAGISSDLATAGATLSSLQYSREFEREADDNGLMLLEKAGIDTDGMLSFYETMGKESPDPGPADILSTHPATSERIERLRKQRRTGLKTRAMPVDFQSFKKQVKTYFNE